MRVGSRAMVVLAVLLGGLTVSVAPAAAAGSVTVTPSTGLVDLDSVTITGTGFNPGSTVAFCQGVDFGTPSSSICGGPIGTGFAETGDFSASYTVHRFMFVPALNRTIDCTVDQCVIAVAEQSDVAGTAVLTPISFAVTPEIVPGSGMVIEGNAGTVNVEVPVHAFVSQFEKTVQWRTYFVPGAGGSQADPSTDYTPASGTVTFAPAETEQAVTIAVNGDTVVEPDEYVVILFMNPTGAVVGGFWGLGFANIANDDALPVITPDAVTSFEGNGGDFPNFIDMPVQLSQRSTGTVTVDFRTYFVPGAGGSQADPSTDYLATTGTVTFAPGEMRRVIQVPITGDTVVEPDEYFVILFMNPTGAVVGGFWGLGFANIANDDP